METKHFPEMEMNY